MKELSIEQKAQAYDEALERVQKELQICGSTDCDAAKQIFRFFPELKEDEDELEWLKQFIQEEVYSLSMDIRDNEDRSKLKKLQRSLEWLEKQGKETSWKPSKEEMDVLYGLAYITNQYDEHKEEVITRLYQDLKREFFNDSSYENMFLTNTSAEDDVRRRSTIQALEYARSLDAYNQYGKADIDKNIAWLEKKGEQRPITEMKSPEESLGISSKEYNEIVNECLYGEEKSSDYVGPKFHEGDWVVDSLVGRVKQVQSVDKYGYNFNNGDFTSFDSANEKNYHLWTIKDARDGDVLVDDCGFVLIYQELSTDGYYHSHCYCNEMTFIGQGGSHGIEHSHPATQRQRELLFQKMDEAHYEWDAEKKELKKIGDISNACEAVESENEIAKAALFFIENCKDDFACNGVAKIDVINWFKEKFYVR